MMKNVFAKQEIYQTSKTNSIPKSVKADKKIRKPTSIGIFTGSSQLLRLCPVLGKNQVLLTSHKLQALFTVALQLKFYPKLDEHSVFFVLSNHYWL